MKSKTSNKKPSNHMIRKLSSLETRLLTKGFEYIEVTREFPYKLFGMNYKPFSLGRATIVTAPIIIGDLSDKFIRKYKRKGFQEIDIIESYDSLGRNRGWKVYGMR